MAEIAYAPQPQATKMSLKLLAEKCAADDTGAGASAVSAVSTTELSTRTAIEHFNFVDTKDITAFLFAIKESMPHLMLPADMIKIIFFQHINKAHQNFARNILQLIGPDIFHERYIQNGLIIPKCLRYDFGNTASDIEPGLRQTIRTNEFYAFDASDWCKYDGKNLKIQGAITPFLSTIFNNPRYRTISITDAPELRRVPEEAWLQLESYLPGRGLTKLEVKNCPKLVLSPKMKAMMERIAYRQRCYNKLVILVLMITVPFLILNNLPQPNESR